MPDRKSRAQVEKPAKAAAKPDVKTGVKRAVKATMNGLKRRRGRPPVGENGLLDKKLIFACAFELSKSTPLQDLSIVRVARELGVTPALIHYYVDGRDALTSSVMNTFYGEVMREWPTLTGQWRVDIEAAARHVYKLCVHYAGVAAYLVSYNRFRLVQIVAPGQTDFGILMFERFVGVVREAGFDAGRTGMYANLLIELVVSAAYATVRHRWPGDHSEVLDQAFSKLDPAEFPHTCFVRRQFSHFGGGMVFADGINLTLSGLDLERSKLGLDAPRRRKRPA